MGGKGRQAETSLTTLVFRERSLRLGFTLPGQTDGTSHAVFKHLPSKVNPPVTSSGYDMGGSGPPLIVERHGPVGWLIFNRPDAANAMDAPMLGALEGAWTELDRDPSVRVIVNTGAGTQFQTGLDMGALVRDPASLREQSRRTKRAELRLTAWHNTVTKPVIAAVNGTCAGGGLHFVADADVVIAASDATFLDPHVSVGQVSAYEPIGLLFKMPGEPVIRMALSGRAERVSAHRAYELGMISQIVDPPERLRAEAQKLAEKMAQNSTMALAATKGALWRALEARRRWSASLPE